MPRRDAGGAPHLVLEDQVFPQDAKRLAEGEQSLVAERSPLILHHHHSAPQLRRNVQRQFTRKRHQTVCLERLTLFWPSWLCPDRTEPPPDTQRKRHVALHTNVTAASFSFLTPAGRHPSCLRGRYGSRSQQPCRQIRGLQKTRTATQTQAGLWWRCSGFI